MSQGFTNNSGIPLPLPATLGGTGLNATTQNQILYSPSANTIAGLSTANSSLLTTSSSGVPSLQSFAWQSYTATITLVGGGGNVTPTFSTQSARYCRIGNVVYVQISFRNPSGGTAGAGTGQVNVALPVAVGANVSASSVTGVGFVATTNAFPCSFSMQPNATTAQLFYLNTSTFASIPVTGATYAASARFLEIQFFYEVD